MSKKFDSGECLLPDFESFLGKEYDAVVFCLPESCVTRISLFMRLHNNYVNDYASHALDNFHVASISYKKLCMARAHNFVKFNYVSMLCYTEGIVDLLSGGNPKLQRSIEMLHNAILEAYNMFEKLSYEWEVNHNIYL